MELSDGVVFLRPLELADAPAVAAACGDPEIARFIPGIPVPYGLDHAQAYLLEAGLAWAARTRCAFAIVEAEGVELCGTIDVGPAEIASIGYWIACESRGQGLATRALVLLSRWALSEGGVQRLEFTTHLENVASQRVAEKAGFVREGVLRSHIRFREGRRDSVLFSLLPSDL